MPRSRSVARFRAARSAQSTGSTRSTGSSGSTRDRAASSQEPLRAALYVEGAADRAILQGWARCVSPQLERKLRKVTVIMGGRQPERAHHHLAQLRNNAPGARGLCVLDRDTEPEPASVAANNYEGLEIYTWSRRHIESYLLVPGAVLRGLRGRIRDPGRVQRELAEHLPAPGDEAAFRTLDAKRLLGPQGPLALCVGKTPPLGRIARMMRREEFHPDIEALLKALARLLQQPLPMPPVVSLRVPERR